MRLQALIAMSLVVGAAWGADTEAKLKGKIAHQYAVYAKSVVRRDVKGAMSCLTPDVTWLMANGKTLHVDEVQKLLDGWLKTIKPGTKAHFTIEKFVVDSPDKVEAYAVLHMDVPGEKVKQKERNLWHDTWVRQNGAWLNSIGEQVPEKANS